MHKYLLLGLGVGNKSIKNFFDKHNIDYLIYDDNIINKDYNNLDFKHINYIVKSNGVSNDHYIINTIKKLNKDVIVLSDLELFYRFFKCLSNKKIICVTGTNGKSTTVTLLKHILNDVNLGGNIGIPLFDFLEDEMLDKDIIIEASSFMGENLIDFMPDISCLLNINPHHLDRHKTLENYIVCKEKIIWKTRDKMCYNYDDLLVRELITKLNCNKISYSKTSLKTDIYIIGSNIYYRENFVLSLKDLNDSLFEYFNKYLDNLLASIALAICYDVSLKEIRNKVSIFVPVKHRYEYLGSFWYNDKKIKVINDSKSTNASSLNMALSKLNVNTLVVCGGKEENGFELKIEPNSLKYIKYVLINGENRFTLKKQFDEYNVNVILYENLNILLDNISLYLDNIDEIIFSPGSQSYDQFKSFEERGEIFKSKLVKLFNL